MKKIKSYLYCAAFLIILFPQQAKADNSEEPTPGLVIDLGLSVNWAGYNLGASSSEENGGYYSWGETKEKEIYNRGTYSLYNKVDGFTNIKDISGNSQYDAARTLWGGDWRMPTRMEVEELISKCIKKRIVYKKVNGFLFIGPNGNSIFLPAAGFRNHYGNDINEVNGISNSVGTYRTSTQYYANKTEQGLFMFFFSASYDNSKVSVDGSDEGYVGRSIRPVIKKNGDTGTATETADDAITLTASSHTRPYGDPNPIFDYTSSGAKVGVPIITCAANKQSPVGSYPIIIEKGSVINSDVSLVNGVLTITEAPLIISVGNYTKKEGEENPEFKLTYMGFKNNETESVLDKKPYVTCQATKNSKAGEYDIVVSGANASNYYITYQLGKLTVLPTNHVKGDINGDGKLTDNDIKALVKLIFEGATNNLVADLNGDGLVNGTDIVKLVNMILGKE